MALRAPKRSTQGFLAPKGSARHQPTDKAKPSLRRELDQYHGLCRRKQRLWQELEELHYMKGKKHSPSTDTGTVESPRKEESDALEEALRQAQESYQAVVLQLKAIDQSIGNISDVTIQEAVRLFYIDGETWDTVAAKLCYPGTRDAVRKRVHRYLS